MKTPWKACIALALVVAMLAVWQFLKQDSGSDSSAAEKKPRPTHRSQPPASGEAPGSSGESGQASGGSAAAIPPDEADRVPGEARGKPLPWSRSVPATAPIVPSGVRLSPAKARVAVAGRVVSPRLQGRHFGKTRLLRGQTAKIHIDWPPEHRADQVMVYTLNGGTVNGGNGGIINVTKDKGSRHIEFEFKAGPDSGYYQVLLRAANIEYGLPFWVDAGPERRNPPAL